MDTLTNCPVGGIASANKCTINVNVREVANGFIVSIQELNWKTSDYIAINISDALEIIKNKLSV